MKTNKVGNEKGIILVTIIAVVAVVIAMVLVAGSFYAIMDGIIGNVTEFFNKIKTAFSDFINGIFKPDIIASMDTYIINNEQVEALRASLESAGIATDAAGLTEIRLRKILLAHGVSTSFADTICVVPVKEEEIVQNLKEKEKYKNINTLNDFLNDPISKAESKDVWPIDNPNYDLYYDSGKFFYFKDEDNIFNGELRGKPMVFGSNWSNNY